MYSFGGAWPSKPMPPLHSSTNVDTQTALRHRCLQFHEAAAVYDIGLRTTSSNTTILLRLDYRSFLVNLCGMYRFPPYTTISSNLRHHADSIRQTFWVPDPSASDRWSLPGTDPVGQCPSVRVAGCRAVPSCNLSPALSFIDACWMIAR